MPLDTTDTVSLGELSKIAMSPQLRNSYIFVAARVSAKELGLKDFDEFHFRDSNGGPVTVLVSSRVLSSSNVEEYEFLKLLENDSGPEFNNGQFYNTSAGMKPVVDVLQSRMVYFHISDRPEEFKTEHTTKPRIDTYYPLVSDPVQLSPARPEPV
jgi:hypothetical protein